MFPHPNGLPRPLRSGLLPLVLRALCLLLPLRYRPVLRPLSACALLLLLGACATAAPFRSSAVRTEPGIPVVLRSTSGAEFQSFAELAAAVSAADIVFFGEQHDDPVTHRAELLMLEALGESRERVILSLEMFERDVQPLLDEYLAGRISEAVFLADSRPWPNYASDYRPMVELAKARGWRVVAANVPRRLASVVSRGGLAALDSLSPGERAYVARDISCPRDDYFTRFSAQMGSHSTGGGDTGASAAIMQRYYEAQCIKDETMGESIAAALVGAPAGTVLMHVNGAFHSDFRLGTVPRALSRAVGKKGVVVTALPVADPAGASIGDGAQRADYIIFVRRGG